MPFTVNKLPVVGIRRCDLKHISAFNRLNGAGLQRCADVGGAAGWVFPPPPSEIKIEGGEILAVVFQHRAWGFKSLPGYLASGRNPNARPTMKTAIADDEASAATDRSEIERLAASFTDSWNSHDMAQFARLFAHDADFVNVVGMWWKNREEIEKAHAYSHSTFFKNSRLSGQIAGLKFLRPDLATVHIPWELVGQIEPDGSVGQPRKGVLLLVCGKQDGAWHIHTAQNTDIVATLTQPAAKA